MSFFKRKPDPIADRDRQLNAQIASLEGQIKRLTSDLELAKSQPKFRSTAMPQPTPPPPGTKEPVFEDVDHQHIKSSPEGENSKEHYNELGLRKFDLVAVWQRLIRLFRPAPPSNPKLLNLLAAGNIHGLRPLRYEKRVARNRFLLLVGFFVLVLWGLLAFLFRKH